METFNSHLHLPVTCIDHSKVIKGGRGVEHSCNDLPISCSDLSPVQVMQAPEEVPPSIPSPPSPFAGHAGPAQGPE